VGNINDCDLVFVSSGVREAINELPKILNLGKRVIDMSGAFRLDKHDFEKWYKVKHPCPESLSESVYGIPSLNRTKIQDARLVANPGCFAISVILPLYPIRKFIRDAVSIVSTSGNSGSGEDTQEESQEWSYDYGRNHQHVPEMEKYSGCRVRNFTPIVMRSVKRGINTNIEASLCRNSELTFDDEWCAYLISKIKDHYIDEDKVVIVQDGDEQWGTKHVKYTHLMLMKVRVEDGSAYINCLIDNLFRGAATQAVENMNIMFGFNRLEGIDVIGQ